MADVFIDRDQLEVVLTPIERVGALHGDICVPLEQVRRASVSTNPFDAVHGLRSPGTGVPGVFALGTWRSRRRGRSFVATYRNQPALVLELEAGQHLRRIVVSTDDAQRLASALS
jgi:hypothetical protein